MVSRDRLKNAVRKAEDAKVASHSGVSPAALARSRAIIARRGSTPDEQRGYEKAKPVYEKAYAEALERGDTEEAAYDIAVHAALDTYMAELD